MVNISLEYQPGESPLHRLHPITKLVVAGSMALIAVAAPGYRGALGVGLLLVGFAIHAGIGPTLLRTVGLLGAPLALALLVIHGFLNPANETVLLEVGPATLGLEGIDFGASLLVRILAVVGTLTAVILTTRPNDLAAALVAQGLSPKLAYVFLASLQFTPDIQRRASLVWQAQQARGLDPKAGLIARFRAIKALMIPLLVGSLIAAETRALALEARGFSHRGPRTQLVELSFAAVERVVLGVAVALGVAALAWRFTT